MAFGVSSGFVALWEIEPQHVLKLGKHQSEVVSATFSPDGSRVATSSADGTIKLWDPVGRKEIRDVLNAVQPGSNGVVSADQFQMCRNRHTALMGGVTCDAN